VCKEGVIGVEESLIADRVWKAAPLAELLEKHKHKHNHFVEVSPHGIEAASFYSLPFKIGNSLAKIMASLKPLHIISVG
jgi:hypothetical protein